ncbi:5,6-dimethylbenzimidazole synthase [Lolliginicoccus levis]|uniref:5,6-dimethylbenzimidazole synthase n=1 Tax=Lolliginicoccus levis TaxID=2919542 RepID=UPI00241CDBCF|nr:5,6-dimethylbenzimidazole synthase [Lolliginicoccus levis]
MPAPLPLYETIAARRDVRAEFTGATIDDAVLCRILEAGHRAPSVGNTQPWDFVVIQDRARLDAFAEHVAARRNAFAAGLDPERRSVFDRIKVEGIRESGTGIVVTYDPDRGGTHVLGRHTVEDTGLFSAVLAIQNIWLAATAEGLGLGWVSFYEEEFLARFVGATPPLRPIAWLCVGPVTHLHEIPDLERHGWRSRRPLSSAIHRDRLGHNGDGPAGNA